MTSLNDDSVKWQKEIGNRIAAAYGANDSSGRREMWNEILRDRKISEGPTISVAELAQIVDVRMRSGFRKKKPSSKEMAAEIEATLDFVALCQCLLHSRQRKWQSWLREACDFDGAKATKAPQTSANAAPSDEEMVRKIIFQKKFPLKFVWGLSAMGNRKSNKADRLEEYERFFKETFPTWDMSAAPQDLQRMFPNGSSPLSDVLQPWQLDPTCPMPENVVSHAFDFHVKHKWPTKESLWWVAQKWLKWWPTRLQRINTEKGEKSGLKRRMLAEKRKFGVSSTA